MLEIPESFTIAKQLEETVRGKVITGVQAGASPHGFAFYFGEPAGYEEQLVGQKIEGAKAIAGYVEMATGDRRISFFDGVNVRYLQPGESLPKKHQLYIGFEDGSGIVCTVQMYGGMFVYREGENDNPYFLVAKEKPGPLTDAFTPAYFDGLVGQVKGKMSAKAFLATEQRIPGLGNGCLQDILFNAGVNPRTKLEKLKDGDLERVYRAVKDTLGQMVDGGGRDTEKDLFGARGGYGTILSSRTVAYACPCCGGGIEKKAFLGGNVYYCPVCQPVVG